MLLKTVCNRWKYKSGTWLSGDNSGQNQPAPNINEVTFLQTPLNRPITLPTGYPACLQKHRTREES